MQKSGSMIYLWRKTMFLKEISTKNFTEIEELIQRAFDEDFAHGDITSGACISEEAWAEGRILLKAWGCIAGLKFLPWIFQLHDPRIETHLFVRDGQVCEAGTILALVRGPARSLLGAERVALNFLQHLSGVATLTARCVEKAKGTGCQILDTRKTILGLRALQKYAVSVGGGVNHRFHLGDRILIKNNHLALAPDAVERARKKFPLGWVEVEIGRGEELESAICSGVNAILLDNMSPDQVRECVVRNAKRVFLEASGGITLDNLTEYAKTGVGGISIGALTHSAPAIDIAMRISS